MRAHRLTVVAACVAVLVAAVAASARAHPIAQPVSGGTVTMAWDQDGASLAPYQETYSIERDVFQHIFETLVVYDPKTHRYVPGLATRWNVSRDGKTWTLKLRRGIKFSDGTSFNAAAAKFTLDWIVNPTSKASPFTSGFLTGYSRSVAVNPTTLVVHFRQVDGRFLDGLSSPNLGMVSPAAVKKYGAAEFGRHPVGTGPFLFKEWVSGSHITLVRNPRYWGKKTYLDSVIFQIIRDDGTRSAALQRGDIQVAFLPFAFNPQYQANKSFKTTVVTRPGTVRAIQFNMQRPIVSDKRVRQAIAYAVDRTAIAHAPFLGGTAGVARTPLSPTTSGYSAGIAKLSVPYNLAKARALLDQAGWTVGSNGIRVKNGQALTLTMRTVKLTFLDQVALLIQSQLKAVGIDLNLNISPDWGTLLPPIQQGDYDMMIGGSFQSDLGLLDANYDPRQIDKSFLVFSRDPSPLLSRLFAKAEATTGVAARQRVYNTIQTTLMNDIALVPMYTEAYVFAATPRLVGVRYSRESEPDYDRAYLTR
jgi:peptide/nickel transport system substrate-binding protein